MPDMSKPENQKPPTEGEVPGSAPDVSPEPTSDPAPAPEPTPSGETKEVSVTLDQDDWSNLLIALRENIRFHEMIDDIQDTRDDDEKKIIDHRNILFDEIESQVNV